MRCLRPGRATPGSFAVHTWPVSAASTVTMGLDGQDPQTAVTHPQPRVVTQDPRRPRPPPVGAARPEPPARDHRRSPSHGAQRVAGFKSCHPDASPLTSSAGEAHFASSHRLERRPLPDRVAQGGWRVTGGYELESGRAAASQWSASSTGPCTDHLASEVGLSRPFAGGRARVQSVRPQPRPPRRCPDS